MREKDANPSPIVVAEDDFLLRMLAIDILTEGRDDGRRSIRP
jgi:hypothetical protein